MSLPNCGAAPRQLENLRIGGGYASTPNGGTDLDQAGNAAFDGDVTVDGALLIGGAVSYRNALRSDHANGGVNRDWCREVNLFGDEVSNINSGATGPTSIPFSTRMFYKAWDFSPTTLQTLNMSFMLPPDYDGSPLRIRLVWLSQTAKGGTSGDVLWRVYLRGFADGVSFAIPNNFSDQLDTFQGVDKFHICDIVHTPENPGKGLPVSMNVRRVADHATDTFNADAQLVKVFISYA